jgi:hypothetical protein
MLISFVSDAVHPFAAVTVIVYPPDEEGLMHRVVAPEDQL